MIKDQLKTYLALSLFWFYKYIVVSLFLGQPKFFVHQAALSKKKQRKYSYTR